MKRLTLHQKYARRRQKPTFFMAAEKRFEHKSRPWPKAPTVWKSVMVNFKSIYHSKSFNAVAISVKAVAHQKSPQKCRVSKRPLHEKAGIKAILQSSRKVMTSRKSLY